ncbi:MAG: hypothetical protein K9K66_04380 [Desulfarculaceae bacterium]|nr:hypothetical protein [Desulfarculaceae bacterium]MCF8073280.1 hypothetical protein [Desulfarculaceae bacterium]MCF8100876.1 hypothetical protein [Desulfarculaceae bacterium]MCF8116668.1 hypothetical protein [Desulfarculaceae bacterium]
MGFCAVDPGLYQYDEAIRGLPDDAFRVLHVLWFREPRHWLGVSRFRPADILPQLPPGWSEKRVQEAVSGLVAAGLALWHPEAKLVFLRPALEHDRASRGERSVIGAYTSLTALPQVPLLVPAYQKLGLAMLDAIDGIKKGDNIPARRARLADMAEVVQDRASRLLEQEEDTPSMDHEWGIDGVSEEGKGSGQCPIDGVSMGHTGGGGDGEKVPDPGGGGEKNLPKKGASMGYLARAGDPSPPPDRPPPKGGSGDRPGLVRRFLKGKGGPDEA